MGGGGKEGNTRKIDGTEKKRSYTESQSKGRTGMVKTQKESGERKPRR